MRCKPPRNCCTSQVLKTQADCGSPLANGFTRALPTSVRLKDRAAPAPISPRWAIGGYKQSRSTRKNKTKVDVVFQSDGRLATLVNPNNIAIYLIQPLISVTYSLGICAQNGRRMSSVNTLSCLGGSGRTIQSNYGVFAYFRSC
jgi:hypothetical protein